MADYYQVKNQNIFTPPANISLGNTSNQYNNVYVQNNLVVGNVTVTSSTIIAPRVTTITYPGNDTAADPAGGQTITLTGSGFVVSASILINSIAVSVVSVVSSTVITFTSPANSSGSYVIYVVNPDGSTAIAVPGIQYSGIPTWTTAAGTLGNLYETASFTQTVVATGDAPITYSVASGTLPPGATFNGNGTITGTSQLTASPTTYTFTVSATDAEQQDTNRSFSLTINTDVVTWTTPAANSTTTLDQNVASTTTLLATSAAGKAITYTANALPTGLSISGATVTGTPSVVGNTSSLFTATAATTGRTTTATINWTITVSGDTYFPYTTLLLSGGTSTSTFIADASTNNFAVAIAGDTKPNNFNPYTPGYYSNYFDGTGDYLTAGTTASNFLCTGSASGITATLEAWVYLTAYNTGGSPWMFSPVHSKGVTYFNFGVASGKVRFYWNGGGLGNIVESASTSDVPLNTWTHIALTISGTTFKIYVNGTLNTTSVTNSGVNAAGSGGAENIGYEGNQPTYFTGYISNYRLTNTIVYSSTFAPSTTPLTAISGTQLLTCQSNRFIDNSTNAFAITKVGDTTVSPTTPFVPNTTYATYGSTYFDGTGDYLTTATNAAFAFGTGDFTMECWFSTTTLGVSQKLITFYPVGSLSGYNAIFIDVGNTVSYGANGAANITSSGTITINTWYHLAAVRLSGTTKLYLNGTQVGSNYTDSTSYLTSRPAIGTDGYSLNTSNFYGYMSNVRVVKGTAVYTGTFTPPSTPLTAITNTSLLTLQTNQPVNNSVFLDNSTNAFAVTRVGNTSAGTFTPYGANWSVYQSDVLSDQLGFTTSVGTSFQFTGNFTIEGWVYYTTLSGDASFYVISDGSTYLALNISMSAGAYNIYLNSGSPTSSFAHGISVGVWTHVAMVRSGSTVTLYTNGVSKGTITNSNTLGYSAPSMNRTGGGVSGVIRYISNVRIVKGTAVYTGNFTPSTTPLTAIANTVLLTCQSNRLIDNSTNAFAATITGNVAVQRFSPFSPSAAYSTSTIGGSGYLSGASSTWLAVPINATFAFGTNNYTYEAWVYPTAFPNAYNTIFCNFRDDEGAKGWSLLITSTGLIHVNNQGTYNNSTNALSLNTWTHIAVCRVGNTVTRYINGVADPTTLTVTASITNVAAQGPTIGGSPEYSTTREWTGYISNARVISRTALYTSNFTPSTTPFTAVSGTSLLLNYTSAGVYDSASMNNLETVGDAKILSTQTPYAGSYYSNYFDGTGDYLTVPSNAALAPSTGDFTCEAWISISVLPSSGGVAAICQNDAPVTPLGNTRFWFGVYNNSGTSQLSLARHDTANRAFVNWTPTVGVWYHVAAVRQSGTVKLFIDGVLQTVTGSTDLSGVSFSQGGFAVGVISTPVYMNGYISNFRYVVGTAVYTSSFTPSITPLTAISGTQLLTCQSNSFLDNSTNLFAVTRAGDTSVQSFNPFQRNSATTMYFDGTGDYLISSPNAEVLNAFGTGNFTVEFWMNSISFANADNIKIVFDCRPLSTDGVYPCIYFSSGQIRYFVSSVDRITGSTLNTGQWYHVALSRSGSSTKLFVDGTQVGSTYTDTNNYLCGANRPVIACRGHTLGETNYNGYINDLRITKGVARYTTTFTPPTSAFLTT